MGDRRSSDPDLNISVSAKDSRILSPFLNFDPKTINDSDQYIFPEGAEHRRGRFEMAFAQIGCAVMSGAVLGGMTGFYRSLQETKELKGSVKSTQMLNIITKQAAAMGKTLGVVGLMYSIFGVILSKSRGVEDEFNTVAAGSMTGLLFKSSAGLKPCLKGGGVGFALSAAYCLYMNQGKIRHNFS